MYTPQTQGAVERANQTVKGLLRGIADWADKLGDVMYVYNTTVHQTTGKTPFEVFFVRPAGPPRFLAGAAEHIHEARGRLLASPAPGVEVNVIDLLGDGRDGVVGLADDIALRAAVQARTLDREAVDRAVQASVAQAAQRMLNRGKRTVDMRNEETVVGARVAVFERRRAIAGRLMRRRYHYYAEVLERVCDTEGRLVKLRVARISDGSIDTNASRAVAVVNASDVRVI